MKLKKIIIMIITYTYNNFFIFENFKLIFFLFFFYCIFEIKFYYFILLTGTLFFFLRKTSENIVLYKQNSIEDSINSEFQYYFYYNPNLTEKSNLFYKNKNSYSFLYLSIIIFFYFIFFYFIFLSNNVFNFYSIQSIFRINFFKKSSADILFNFDYISIYFIILTNFIFVIIFYAFNSLKNKKDYNSEHKTFLLLLFITQILIVLTFSVSNLFFFFFFFEVSLLPVYLLMQIGGKGLKKKQYAGLSLMFFTLTGSIFLLFSIMFLLCATESFDFKHLSLELLDFNTQLVLFFFFFLGFSVKIPIFPFYSWLPEAHVEASTVISIILASIFLKIATYGLLKIVVFNFFLVISFCYSFIVFFSLISVFLATFLTLIQTDLKKIIALSSIIHMNYMVIAIFSLDAKAILGSFIYMFSHALISSGLFYLIGIIYENTSTRDLLNFDKVNNFKFYFYFFIFNLANISFPLTISFISEILILNNLLFFNSFFLIFLIFFIFFSAIYTFWLIHNVFFGKFFLKKNIIILSKLDIYFLNILIFLIFVLGIIPTIIMFNIEQEIYLSLIKKISTF